MKPNIHPQLQNFLQDLILPHASFYYRVGNNMFKINNRNTRTRCEICLKLTIKTPERRQVNADWVVAHVVSATA